MPWRVPRVAETASRQVSNISHTTPAPNLVLNSKTEILRRATNRLTRIPILDKTTTHLRLPVAEPFKASQWSLFLILGGTLLTAILAEPYLRERETVPAPSSLSRGTSAKASSPADRALSRTRRYSEMPTPQGHRGNLTADQEQKLQEFWTLVLKVFDVKGANNTSAAATPSINEISTQPNSPKPNTTTTNSKKSNSKKLHSLFGGSKKAATDKNDATSIPSTPSAATAAEPTATATEGDKYGQSKEFQQILGEMTAEELRCTFWSMVKADHPDHLLLRFLRARKWEPQRALVMLVSTLRWRHKEMRVDEDIVFKGEGGALKDSQRTDDAVAKKEAEDFLAQMRKGKSFLHGVDREGRPLCFVRVRLHKSGEQSEKTMERYTVHVIETARLVLRPPIETATILFDMTSFTVSNMDYPPLKFMIKIFEANYPESLGAILVHRSPWVFQSIWAIIKGWLDPVVAGKVHFTKTVEDLEKFIPKSQIVKELGGDEEWEYRYVEPSEGENDTMKDTETRARLEQETKALVDEFQTRTFEWLTTKKDDQEEAATAASAAAAIVEQRDQLAKRLNDNYWSLDPYLRAKSLYDRQGMIKAGGHIDFYPSPTTSQQQQTDATVPTSLQNGDISTTTPGTSQQQAGNPNDDVD